MEFQFYGEKYGHAHPGAGLWHRVFQQGARLLAVVVGLLVLCTCHVRAADIDIADKESLAPYFQVKGAAAGVDALPLKDTEVEAVLAGVIAEVRVVQTYKNEGDTTLEARYIFPGSTRAAVHGMTMTIGDRRIEAEIKEKAEARKVYEEAKKEGRTASLLEAKRSNVFEMNLANILPGDVVKVELRYTELIPQTDAEYEWVFPTVVGPRYVRGPASETKETKEKTEDKDKVAPTQKPGATEERVGGVAYTRAGQETEPQFKLTAQVAAGAPIRSIKCVTHNVDIVDEPNNGKRVSFTPEGEGLAMNRDFILRYRLTGEALQSGLVIDEWKGEKFFLLTVQPPQRVAKAEIPPRDYVFVVDVSGSMGGFPLETAKKVLRELLMGMHDGDSFNVLLFSGSSEALAPEPIQATPENIAAALAIMRGFSGAGGTELLPALKHALSLPTRPGVARSIVVVTDGYVEVEAEAYALVREKLGEANLFAFGIGSSVNRELIERLARAGRSEPAVIEGEKRAIEVAQQFRKMIEAPVLTHVTTEFSGFFSSDVIPQIQPDVLAQRPLVMVGKWTGDAKGTIKLSGHTGDGEWRTEVNVSDAIDLQGRGILAQLWAREKLMELRDLHAVRYEADKQKAAIVALGIKYNLLTPFTSFVAVDKTPRVPAGTDVKKVNQPNSLPQGVSEAAVGEQDVPTSPEPATMGLMLIGAAAAAWCVWKRRRAAVQQ